MNCHHQILYMAWGDEDYIFGTSFDLAFDLKVLNSLGFNNISPLTEPLPFGYIVFIAKEVKIKLQVNEKFNRGKREEIFQNLRKRCRKVITRLGLNPGINQELENIDLSYPIALPGRDEVALKELLRGRFLLGSEIKKLIIEKGLKSFYPEDYILQYLYLTGEVEKFPAVTLKDYGDFFCQRCGQTNSIFHSHCNYCNQNCSYCEECLNMGQARLCEIAYASKGSIGISRREIHLKFDFRLSQAQEIAFQKLKDFVTKRQFSHALVWAACGSGKTEVSYAAIAETLKKGGKVLFAIPRRDVVLELEPRIKKAFPKEKIAAFYGGSTEKYTEVDICLATTHQTIRFYRAFDLVVLDEADAYPYVGNQMLYYCLERARKKDGQMIYMTATPDPTIFHKKPEVIKIPARYHGKPLPVPRLLTSRPKELVSEKAIIFLQQSRKSGHQVFVFVPSVAMAAKVGKYLQKIFGNEAQSCHAGDSQRDQKRLDFAAGKTEFLVTTTIMERGITVPGVNVLVLSADYEKVFDERTLVQMAGRAGRTGDGYGEVIFQAQTSNHSIRRAIANIKSLNNEAWHQGLLKEKP